MSVLLLIDRKAHQSYLFIYVFVYLFVYLFICLCLYVYMLICLFICLFVCLFVYLFIYLFIYPFHKLSHGTHLCIWFVPWAMWSLLHSHGDNPNHSYTEVAAISFIYFSADRQNKTFTNLLQCIQGKYFEYRITFLRDGFLFELIILIMLIIMVINCPSFLSNIQQAWQTPYQLSVLLCKFQQVNPHWVDQDGTPVPRK